MIQETQLSTDGNGNEIQNLNVTLSVPVKDIAGLIAINYEELSSKVIGQLDMSALASDVVDEISTNDLVEKVIDGIDMDDLARSFKDQIDISDYIDTSEITSDAADMIDVEDKVQDLLNNYNPSSACALGDLASKAMINAIRYDIMCHLYGQDKSQIDETITDVLRKFIIQELAKIEEAKTTFTLGEIVDVLSKINDVDNKISEVIKAFTEKPHLVMKTYIGSEFIPDNPEVIIKAD